MKATNSNNAELEWGVATRAFPGEDHSGDTHFVARTSIGWLLAVADGLGHGPEAAVAGRAFVEVLAQNKEEAPVVLIRLCHEALKKTRGSAASVVAIDRDRRLLSWTAVGNVEGVIYRIRPPSSTTYIAMRGGIIGYRLPVLRPSFLSLQDGDTLFLATDGIDSKFVRVVGLPHPPDRLAGYILDRFGKDTDDALVLVARWRFRVAHGEGSV